MHGVIHYTASQNIMKQGGLALLRFTQGTSLINKLQDLYNEKM
jgi:hypothetical protein